MAGSETKLDFSSNSAEAERAIQRLTKENAKLRESMRQTNESSKRGAMDAMGANRSFADSLGVAITKFTTLGAIGTAVYSNLQQRADELAQRHKTLLPLLSKPLAESGRMDSLPQMEQFLTKMQAQGVTREHGMAAFEGAAAAGELNVEQQIGIASKAAPFGQSGMDVRRFSGLMADLKKAAPDMSDQDIADTALGMKRLLGEKANQFSGDAWQKQVGRLRESGMSGPDAINYAIAGLGRDEKGTALSLVDQKLSRKPMSRDDKKELARVFDPTAIAEIGSQMEKFRASDFSDQQLSFTPGGNRSENAVKVAQDRATMLRGPQEATRRNVREAYTEGLDGRRDVSAGIQRMFDPIYRTLDNILVAVGAESPEGQAASLAKAGVKSGTFGQGQANELLAELKTQTAIMKQESTRRPVVPDGKETP